MIRWIVFLFCILLFIGQASAYTSVSVIPEKQFIGLGESVNVTIQVNTNEGIAGIQSNLNFNRNIIRVNYIAEGDLFLPYTTFFNEGSIDNENGTIVNIFDAIIGRHNVSSPGSFVVLNVTGIGYGNTQMELWNVKIASPEGEPVQFSQTNTSMKVTRFGTISGGVRTP